MAVILTCMVALVFTNVVLRYGFSSGLRPSVELSRLGLVWVVMLGAAVVLRRGGFSLLRNFLNDFSKSGTRTKTSCWVIVLISVGMLYVGSYRQMMSNWSDISQLTGLPSALFYSQVALSGFVNGRDCLYSNLQARLAAR
ncbi:TRAP transporter small permease subunit [Vibrio lentus]|nr:TRAP transporter small permease subunit [Vibrio lentus]